MDGAGVKFVFVKSNRLGSWLIRLGLGGRTSHFAICFDETAAGDGIVIHSQSSGPKLGWLDGFLKKHFIIYAYSLKRQMTILEEDLLFRTIVARHEAEYKDHPALLWWGLRAVVRRLIRRKDPLENLFALKNTELTFALKDAIPGFSEYCTANRIDLATIAPDDLAAAFCRSGLFVHEKHWAILANGLHW